jgi:hypothetical protein
MVWTATAPTPLHVAPDSDTDEDMQFMRGGGGGGGGSGGSGRGGGGGLLLAVGGQDSSVCVEALQCSSVNGWRAGWREPFWLPTTTTQDALLMRREFGLVALRL